MVSVISFGKPASGTGNELQDEVIIASKRLIALSKKYRILFILSAGKVLKLDSKSKS